MPDDGWFRTLVVAYPLRIYLNRGIYNLFLSVVALFALFYWLVPKKCKLFILLSHDIIVSWWVDLFHSFYCQYQISC